MTEHRSTLSPSDTAQRLNLPLRRLRQREPGLPPGLTDRHLLEALRDRGWVTRERVESYLVAHYRSAFASQPIDPDSALRAVEALEEELSRIPAEALSATLAELMPAAVATPSSEPTPDPTPAEPTPLPEAAAPPPSPAPPERPRTPRIRTLIGLLLFTLGLGTAELARRGSDLFLERVLGRPSENAVRARLEKLEEDVAANPDSTGRLYSLRGYAYNTGRLTEAYLATLRLQARRPEDQELQRDLVRLHLYSDDPLLHDLTRARQLAEAEHARSPSDLTLHLLAEVAYAEGDLDTAIAYGRQAVESNPDPSRGREYYQQFLNRYLAARRRASSEPGED